MSTLQIATKKWTNGAHTLGPVSKPAATSLVSFQVAANTTTDWQSGTPGRTADLLVQFSTDGGQTWLNRAEGSLPTPDMGHNGAFPTLLEVDISNDADTTQYQGVLTVSGGAITTGWDILLQ